MTDLKKRNLKKIRRIARYVRKAFDNIAKAQGRSPNLGGFCGRSAAQMFLECRRKGINVQIANARGHAFCTYAGHVIDVTATQFGVCQDVVIKPRSQVTRPYHQVIAQYNSVHKAMSNVIMGLYMTNTYKDEDRKIVIEHRR
jgi:hypothetical protein